MIKILQIGVGKWGGNILRTLAEMKGVEVVVIDTNFSSVLKGRGFSPSSEGEIEGVDGVIIATPGSTHAEVALPYIKRGLPVFIEKPMTTSLLEAKKIERAAKKSGSNIFVGHIHLYNSAWIKAKEQTEKIGIIKLLQFEGMGQGPVRKDMSVWWDWGPHGISLALNLLHKSPASVQGWGLKLLKPKSGLDDVVQARLTWADGVEMLSSVSWMAPEKRMKMTIVGNKGSVIFDDRAAKKVTLVIGDKVTYPKYANKSPLEEELKGFIKMVKTGKQPVTDIRNGVEVVKVLAAGEKSINLDGKKVRC